MFTIDEQHYLILLYMQASWVENVSQQEQRELENHLFKISFFKTNLLATLFAEEPRSTSCASQATATTTLQQHHLSRHLRQRERLPDRRSWLKSWIFRWIRRVRKSVIEQSDDNVGGSVIVLRRKMSFPDQGVAIAVANALSVPPPVPAKHFGSGWTPITCQLCGGGYQHVSFYFQTGF